MPLPSTTFTPTPANADHDAPIVITHQECDLQLSGLLQAFQQLADLGVLHARVEALEA